VPFVKQEPQKIIIDYSPQEYQRQIHNSKARRRVVIIGRRGGKTETALNEIIRKGVTIPGRYWFVCPTYKQVKLIAWQRLKTLLKVDALWKFNEQELHAYHPALNTSIALKGADNEDSLRGVGLDGCVLDECATLKGNVWPEVIRPMLADSQGWAMFISTPRGKNWLYDLYTKQDPDLETWHYPTAVNQYIAQEEIEQMKKDMSERLFRQEILAEFLDEESGVFRKVRTCITGKFEYPVLGRFYIMGVDLAKTQDFTVLAVFDTITRHCVAFERFQDISWTEQKVRIQQLANRYNNALCFVDASGVGDPIYEDLLTSGVSCEPFKFTNESKRQLIEQLAISIEQRLITFPAVEELIAELDSFEYELTERGKIIYGAPEGKHDDCVIALALANWGLRQYVNQAQILQSRERDITDRSGRGELVTPHYDFGSKFGGY
jgi:hypothetical protein